MADTCGDPLDCDDVKLGMAAIQAASYVRLADGPNGELRTARRVASCTGGGGGSTVPADLPYLYTSATSGDPGAGAIGFNTVTPASINSVRIKFGDDDGTDHVGLVNQLTATGGTMLFRWDGGSLVLRVGANVGSFGSWAQFDATYVSGGLPADGAAMSVDVGLYSTAPSDRFYATVTDGTTDPSVFSTGLNNFGGSPALARPGTGQYVLTITGAFPVGARTYVTIGITNADVKSWHWERADDDSINIYFFDETATPRNSSTFTIIVERLRA